MDTQLLGHVALSYSPIIDRNRSASTTRLTVFPLLPGTDLDAVALLRTLEEVWPIGGPSVALNILSERLLHDVLMHQPATHFMLEVPAFMAAQPENLLALQQLHANGNTLLLKGRPVQQLPKEVLPLFKYSIIDIADDRRIDQNTGGIGLAPAGVMRSIGYVQSGIRTVSEMEAAFRRGAVAVLGWPVEDALQSATRASDQPGLQVIVELIDQVHKEAPIERLEDILKRDPPLAYKLMRYINSPAFGLSVEIGSFRHAIMILGYQRLKRWLALLLATANKDSNLRPVMFAAVRRGMLMEELVRNTADEEMRNEMFICGVFSLLDRMFRQPFSELLKTIPVPERVYQALADNTGPYQSYFELVYAVEGDSLDSIRHAADNLIISFTEINQALLRSLANASQLDD